MDSFKCDCGEVLDWADFGTCEVCEKPKCPDCFTMDEDAEICDGCLDCLT